MDQVVLTPVEGVAERAPGALAQPPDLLEPVGQAAARVGQDRSAAQAVEVALLAVEQGEHGPSAALAHLQDPLGLLGHVGHDPLGGVGGCGGAHVGDEVEDGGVGLVPDGGDQRRGDGGDRPHDRLVGEGEQVLDRAASAGHHDDVDGRVAVEGLHGLDHLAGGVHALDRCVPDGEPHPGPAAPGVLQHVALRGRPLGRDQPDPAGQERQGALELGGEQALRGEQPASPLEPGEQLALADEPDLAGGQRQRAAGGVEGGLGVRDHLGALDQRRGQGVDDPARAGDGDRDVGQLVAQGQEDGVHAPASRDLGDLALDPHRAQPVDPLADRLRDLAHRRRVLGRGVQGHGPHPRATPRRAGAAPPTMGGMVDLGTPSVLSPDEADRAVRLAAPRGYCAGVDRAVITVEKALDLYGSPVYVRKQIVHNKHVVANLESRGAIFVEELDEVPEGRPSCSRPTGSPRWCTSRRPSAT